MIGRERTIYVSDAPAIAGLGFRLYREQLDLPPLMEICRQIQESSEKGWTPTEENLKAGDDGEDPQPARDVLIASIDQSPIGFTWLTRWTETPNLRVYLHRGWIKPSFRRRGIGSALLRWQEMHSGKLIKADPHRGPFCFGGNADENQTSHRALLLSQGYQIAFTNVWMDRETLNDLPELPLPPGVEWRAVQESEIPQIFAALTQVLWDTNPDYVQESHCDPALWCVAWAGDRIAGVAIHHIEDLTVHTPWLAVMPEFRRQGIGAALLVEGLTRTRRRGAQQARIFSNLQNPDHAAKLYQRMGYRITRRLPRFRKPVEDKANA